MYINIMNLQIDNIDYPKLENQLLRFLEMLNKIGYSDITASFIPRSGWISLLRQIDFKVDDSMRQVIKLLLYTEPVDIGGLPASFASFLIPMVDLGIFHLTGDNQVAMPNLTLSHMLGKWLFLAPEGPNPSVYFGDDTLGLACRLRPKRGGASLDLCAGPGTLAILSSDTAKSVVALEMNPIAVAIARLNVAANAISNLDVQWGDLETHHFDMQFDHISANPPLLPVPNEIEFPFVGDGGCDGLKVTSKIIARLPSLLRIDGTAQIIGTGFCSSEHYAFEGHLTELATLHSLQIEVIVIAKISVESDAPYFDAMVRTVSVASEADREAARSTYADLISSVSATHLCTFALKITHGSAKVSVRDFSRGNLAGLWLI
jgi:release factor glutamine methyltransferase